MRIQAVILLVLLFLGVASADQDRIVRGMLEDESTVEQDDLEETLNERDGDVLHGRDLRRRHRMNTRNYYSDSSGKGGGKGGSKGGAKGRRMMGKSKSRSNRRFTDFPTFTPLFTRFPTFVPIDRDTPVPTTQSASAAPSTAGEASAAPSGPLTPSFSSAPSNSRSPSIVPSNSNAPSQSNAPSGGMLLQNVFSLLVAASFSCFDIHMLTMTFPFPFRFMIMLPLSQPPLV